MEITYLGEVIPEGQYKRYAPNFSDDGYEVVDVQVETVCSHCDGSGLCVCDCGYEHPCGSCQGTGREWHGDAIYIKAAYYMELVARYKTRELIRQRYGQMTESLADWWQG